MNLNLFNLSEMNNESAEDTREQTFHIFGQMAPDEENKLDLLIDMIHRIRRYRKDGSPHPVIIQFSMHTFRQKIWKASCNTKVMKEKKL